MKDALEWKIKQETFAELFNDRVTKFGKHDFQLWKKTDGSVGSLTYAQVGRIVKEMAAGLMSLGIMPGDRVALMSYNCPEWLWADFSITNAAAASATVYPSLSAKELAFIVNDSGSRLLLVQNTDMLKRALAEWDGMPTLEKVIVFEEGFTSDLPNVLSLAQLRELGVLHLVRNPLDYERRWRSVDIHDLMTIIYTSGTTGLQKGAMHSHFSINAAMNRDARWSIPWDTDDVCLSFLPLAHSYERECGQYHAISMGTKIAYAQNPSTVMQDMQLFKPTVFMSVPRIYERIFVALRDMASATPEGAAAFDGAVKIGLAVIDKISDEYGCVDMTEGFDLTEGLDDELKAKYKAVDAAVFSKVRAMLGGRYRAAWSAAAALSPDLNKLYLAMGVRVIEGYGLTESCNTITSNPVDAILPGSVGPANAGVEIKLDEDGELLARGDNMFLGYWNNPEETAAVFTDDGYFRTGDIAQILPNGYVKIVDRKKTIIVLDTGKNVASSKVERQFAVSSWVAEAFAVGDDRKYIGALIGPNFDAFVNYFKKEGIPFDESQVEYMGEGTARMCIRVGEDFIQNEQLKAIISKEVEAVNKDLEEYERIKQYSIISRKFSEALGEVTPTLKLKKKYILQNFAAQVEGLYS